MTNAEHLRQCTDDQLSKELLLLVVTMGTVLRLGNHVNEELLLKVLQRPHEAGSLLNYVPEPSGEVHDAQPKTV